MVAFKFTILTLLIYINLLLCCPLKARSQEPNNILEENKIKTTTSKVNHKKTITIDPIIISDSPINNNVDVKTNTTTINSEELKTTDVSTLSSVLEEQAGIYSLQAIHGKDIQLRGLGSAYIQFNIDGMPLIGRTAGIFDSDKISVRNQIEKIEIIKGPSLEYGNQAIAGVINIVTKPIPEGSHIQSNIKASSFNTYDLGVTADFKKKYNGVSMFIGRYSTSGYHIIKNNSKLQTTFPLYNYSAGAKYTFNKNKLDFKLNTIYAYEHQFLEQSTVKNAKDQNIISRVNLSPELTYTIDNKSFIKVRSYLTAFNNNTHSYSKQTNLLLEDAYFNEALYKVNSTYNFNISNNSSFKLGLENYYETLAATRYDNKVSRNTTRSFLIFDIRNLFIKKLEISPGISYDLVSTPTSNVSPSLNINYDFSDSLAANFYVVRGFSMPDFRQLYMNFANGGYGYVVIGTEEIRNYIKKLQDSGNMGNLVLDLDNFKYLEPEYSWNYSFSLAKKFSNAVISASYFINKIHNLIDPIEVGSKNDNIKTKIYSYRNFNKIHIDGLDLNTNIYITSKLQASIGFQYLNAYDTEVRRKAQLENKHDGGLMNRSKYSGTIKLSYAISKYVEASIRSIWRTRYGYLDLNGDGFLNNDDEYLPGYMIANASINTYLMQKKLNINFSVNNIGNYINNNLPNFVGRIFGISILYNYSIN